MLVPIATDGETKTVRWLSCGIGAVHVVVDSSASMLPKMLFLK